ncbi:hypothetical protein CYLTODRAFT_425248 [Cylindrobasidium torrendii FP15055 ss-10]|uniref:Uncharacterized protein n=1 Tax=Cylindrobasidium torrendii FP15055 ss-10 TaxID=1314674 RepID=A0A0D7B179_9AGAR|nr:hypothetical protein CYLTODRAFT_425248 [Cylindrobasidium torrendii FP15055 ss-10]
MKDAPAHLYIPKAHMEVPIVIPYYATASKPVVAASRALRGIPHIRSKEREQ